MHRAVKEVEKAAPLLENGGLVLLQGQLVVDVLKLDGAGVVAVPHPAGAVGKHPLKGNGLLGGAGMPSSRRAVFTMRSIFLRSALLNRGLPAGFSLLSFLNNARHLLLGVCLPHEGGIIVVGAVGPDFWPDEAGLVKLLRHHLGRLAVALVHPKEKEREHDRDHGKGGKAQVAAAPDKKVDRHTDQCAGPRSRRSAVWSGRTEFWI